MALEIPSGRAARQHMQHEPARAVNPVLDGSAGARLYGFLDGLAVRGQQPVASRFRGHVGHISQKTDFGPYLAQ